MTPGPVEALVVLPDGTVWARWGSAIGRLDGDTWSMFPFADSETPLPEQDGPVFPSSFASTPDGDLWVAFGKGWTEIPPRYPQSAGLARFDGTSWELVDPVGDGTAPLTGPLATGADGTLWVYRLVDWVPYLARFDGTSWVVYGPDDGVEKVGRPGAVLGQMVVDRDGAVWVPYPDHVGGTMSMASFDGKTWTSHGLSPEAEYGSLVFAPDGSLWATGEDGVLVYRP